VIRHLLIGGAATLALAASAVAQPMASQPMTSHPMTSMSAPPPGASTQALPTPDFLTAAAQSDEFEVKEGRMAEMHGKSAKVREMGAMMVKAHTETTEMVKAAARKAGMPPMAPPGLDAGQQQMIAALAATHGADFDRTYVDQQLKAHHMALGVMSAYAMNGPPGPIRNAAAKIVPVIKSHIVKFQALQGMMG
jgi:putative membrane protein